MRLTTILASAVTILAASSCNTPEPSKTMLSLTTNGKPVDTVGIIDELQGLLSLSTGPGAPNRSFTITAAESEDTLRLTIEPKLRAVHITTLGKLLDTIISQPSPWFPAVLTLHYTDNHPETVELLQLDTVNGYPLEIDHASAQWTYEEKPTYMTGLLASGAAVSYLDYRLKQPLPSSSYTLGLDNPSGERSEAAEMVSSLLGAVGPISSSFTINSEDTIITPLWDSLRVNHRLHIDSIQLSLNWAYVEFPYREFSRYTDQDTMITSSIDKLRSAPPYIFHTLVAPRLSGVITDYWWVPDPYECQHD
ncbi:hypothetical protein [Sinomicrobium sp. M5D2P9]